MVLVMHFGWLFSSKVCLKACFKVGKIWLQFFPYLSLLLSTSLLNDIHIIIICVYVCVCVYMYVCVLVCACMCTCVTVFWKTDQIVTQGLFHYIGPANSYTHTLPIHSAITRLDWLVWRDHEFLWPYECATKTIGPMEDTTWKAWA